MAQVKSEPKLNAPIPGMSLTSEPGNRPWEKPPRITNVDDAIMFYVEKLTEPENAALILEQVEDGMPLLLMADMFQTGAVAKGVHTLDVGIIVSPVIVEIMKAMAEDSDIPYTIGTEKDAKAGMEDDGLIDRTISEVLSSEDITEEVVEEEFPADEDPETNTEGKSAKAGLMARRTATTPEGDEDGV